MWQVVPSPRLEGGRVQHCFSLEDISCCQAQIERNLALPPSQNTTVSPVTDEPSAKVSVTLLPSSLTSETFLLNFNVVSSDLPTLLTFQSYLLQYLDPQQIASEA
jgi:hypothetical protein